MTPEKTLIQAAWVFPMDRDAIRDGAVVFDDRGILVDVDEITAARAAHPDAVVIDRGGAALLPGLINPHTHLELSLCEPCAPPASFTDWILALRARAKLDGTNDEATVTAAVERGVGQSLRSGVTCIGDISRLASLVRPALAKTPIRAVSFGEILAVASFRNEAPGQIERALDRAYETDRLRIGISPHAPYTIEPDGLGQSLVAAKRHGLPLTMHVAELPYEAEFLAHHAGPFRELLETLRRWDEHVPRFEGGPIRYVGSLGLLDHPSLLAHVNYCDDEELAMLARGRAGVVYCPRTHAFFGHPPHRWRDMLHRGINVTIGTDSCASSPDLNLLDELRFMRRLAPDFPPAALWELATVRAARSLQLQQTIGTLTAGKSADLVVFPIRTNDPLGELLDEDTVPAEVFIAGKTVHSAARR